VNRAGPLSFLEVRAAGASFAIPTAHVERIVAAGEWAGEPPARLGALLGIDDPLSLEEERGKRVVLLALENEELPLVIGEVIGVTTIASTDILPLPPLVRRIAPRLGGLALREGAAHLLVLDTAALLERAGT
jgi:chemotaxis signal transduction protein